MQIPSHGNSLALYGSVGCHLCEEAVALLKALAVNANYIDIAEDDALMLRYGVRIPVLRRDDGAELGWPFGAVEVQRFVFLAHLLEASPPK